MKRSFLVGVLVASVAMAVYLIFFRASDESRIRERLGQLAVAVRIDGNEQSPLTRAVRIRNGFAEVFTRDASATIAELEDTLEGRDAMVAAAIQLGGVYQSEDVSFGGVTVRIDGTDAELKATATVTGATHGGDVRRDELRVTLKLKKIDGDWRVVSAVVEPRSGKG